jgi:hypothetical protein
VIDIPLVTPALIQATSSSVPMRQVLPSLSAFGFVPARDHPSSIIRSAAGAPESVAMIDTQHACPDALFAAGAHPGDAGVAPVMRGKHDLAAHVRPRGGVGVAAVAESADCRSGVGDDKRRALPGREGASERPKKLGMRWGPKVEVGPRFAECRAPSATRTRTAQRPVTHGQRDRLRTNR